MGAWLDLLSASPTPPLWLDDTDYSGRLLSNGRIPWLDATALIAWRRQAVSLLKPSLVIIDVGRVVAAFGASVSNVFTASASYRSVDLLDSLLSAPALRRHLVEVVRGLRQSARLSVALVMPSPRAWPRVAYQNALLGATTTVSDDETDEASVCIAGFLRSVAEAGVDVLLLVDDHDTRPRDASAVDLYQSVLNVAGHYGWDVGLKTPEVPAGDLKLDFMIAPKGAIGVDIGAVFWEADDGVPATEPGGFWYSRVPADANPEQVLERLAALRVR